MGVACSGACVPKMAADCICVPEPFGSTTSLHTHDACEEDPEYLAALADLRGTTGPSTPPIRKTLNGKIDIIEPDGTKCCK